MANTKNEDKGSKAFKETIENHLKSRAKKELLFLRKLNNPKKSIDECIKYVLSTVSESGICGWEDGEIFGMAVHYYDEEKAELLKIKKDPNMRVVVNHKLLLTEEEKAEAKADAINEVIDEEKAKMRKKPTKPKVPEPDKSNAGDSAIGTLF